MTDDWQDLKAELKWCLDEGSGGPRTKAALKWAVEMIETQCVDEARAVIAAAEEREKTE
jgi:hypothetical protein